MDYLVMWGGKLKGREKLYQTGDAAAHERIVQKLRSGEKVRWNVVAAATAAEQAEKEPKKEC